MYDEVKLVEGPMFAWRHMQSVLLSEVQEPDLKIPHEAKRVDTFPRREIGSHY